MFETMIDAGRPFYFRGKGRLVSWLGPTEGIRSCSVFGSMFTLDLSDWIQRCIYFGIFEPSETKLIESYLRPGMTFVDVGANVGYYTALAARLVGAQGRVIAFEPSSYAFERLKRLVETNQLANVTAVHAGLSEQPGALKLYLGIGSSNHTPTMVAHDNTTSVEVPVQRLDSIMEEMGVDRIDLVKIDVEGHEPKVLAGARKLLSSRSIHAILCEFNQHWLERAGSGPDELRALIAGHGLTEVSPPSSYGSLDNRFFKLGPSQ